MATINLWALAKFELTKNTNHVEIKEAQGALSIETTGGDPYAVFKTSSVGADDCVLDFEYFCPEGISDMQIYYGPPISPSTCVSMGNLPKSETWNKACLNLKAATNQVWNNSFTQIRLDFGALAKLRLQVRNIVLRPPNSDERMAQKEKQETHAKLAQKGEKYAAFYRKDFPAKVLEVKVLTDSLEILVSVKGRQKDLRIAKINMWQDLAGITEFEKTFPLTQTNKQIDSKTIYSAKIPRFEGDCDNMLSKFAVLAKDGKGEFVLVSFAGYANNFEAVQNNLEPKPIIKSKKGITCAESIIVGNSSELADLGVRHITINVVLNQFLRDSGDSVEHDFCGKKYSFRKSIIDRLDAVAKYSEENSIIASGIVLIRQPQSEIEKILCHPGALSFSAYTMPNLTNQEGFTLYAALIDFLCKRYSQKNAHGRIDNWIIHNEVDYAADWTDMGRVPMSLYMEQYMRSMRIVEVLSKKYSKHSRVFISLTHNWQSPVDNSWRTYCVKDMLDYLCAASLLETNFDWGVAYHPYPKNLFKADAWNDTGLEFNFNTPIITLKNIEVLFAYLNKKEFLYAAKPRTVIFSEQGFHSDYTKSGFAQQCAAFLYAWKRIEKIDTLEAFHNHRWQDHPNEGGLLLGLRKLPQEGSSLGDPKEAWEVFKALDTPKQKEFERKYIKIIGEKNMLDFDLSRMKAK